ncbi:MAG: hypothetical protein ACMXYB_03205 [Candidatus Woesearchaeota archaeon]
MAGFDKSLDKEIFSTQKEYETSKLIVSIMSYNEGEKKLQIARENLDMNSGEWRWNKLGRLRKEEVENLQKLMEEAKEHM